MREGEGIGRAARMFLGPCLALVLLGTCLAVPTAAHNDDEPASCTHQVQDYCLTPGVAVQGVIPEAGAGRRYTFDVPSGGAATVVDLTDLPADYDLVVRDPFGRVVAQSVHEDLTPEHVELDLGHGQYTVEVLSDPSRLADPDATFTLTLGLAPHAATVPSPTAAPTLTGPPTAAPPVTPVPDPTGRPTPVPSTIGHEVLVNGTYHLKLTAAQAAAGTADKFGDEVGRADLPPCVAFIIRGPIEMDLRMGYGGWDVWSDVPNSLEFFQNLLSEKVDELRKHQTCPSRGIRLLQLPGDASPTPAPAPAARPQAVALYRYFHNDTNPQARDHWATTQAPGPDYVREERLGYIWVQPPASSLPLYDCYLRNEMDHMLDIRPDCSGSENRGLLGYASLAQVPNSIPIYRCHNDGIYDHMVSLDLNCEGYREEWLIGYILKSAP